MLRPSEWSVKSKNLFEHKRFVKKKIFLINFEYTFIHKSNKIFKSVFDGFYKFKSKANEEYYFIEYYFFKLIMLNAIFFATFLTIHLTIYHKWCELSRLTYVYMNNLDESNAHLISLHKSKPQFWFDVKQKNVSTKKKKIILL